MHAIVVPRFGDETVLRDEDIPIPEPGEGEVRVRIEAAGVNPVETYIRSGVYGTLPALPYTPGSDGAGLVDKVGPGVRAPREGQRVFVAAAKSRRNTGTYAEYVVCDADCARLLPESLSFAEGAGLGTPGLAAVDALFSRAGTRPGEKVLVHGATGGVGTLAVQLARQAGAVVFGTAGTAEGEALLRRLGAHEVFNHREEGYLERIADASAPGPDVILEMLANVNLNGDLALLAPRGRVVVVGSRGSLEFTPRDVMSKDAAILGMLLGNMPREAWVSALYRLSAALENGLRVVVSRSIPLARAALAHTLVIGEGKTGKIVLTTVPD